MRKCYGSILCLVWIVLLTLPGLVSANFYFPADTVIPECYEVSEKGAEPITNKYGATSFHVTSITAVPEWVNQLKMADPLNIRVRYEVTHCRPFYIFIQPISQNSEHVTSFTSPSPIFGPGEKLQGEYIAFTGFQRKQGDTSVGRPASIEGVRVSFVDYGTSNEVASFEFEFRATWFDDDNHQAIVGNSFEKPLCINDHPWPAESALPISACESGISFSKQAGYTVKQRVDLNADGICELIVEAEYCKKIYGNVCYLIYEERDGLYQKIFQFYNALDYFEPLNGYARLGSLEYGTRYDIYRMGEYIAGKYRTTYLREPCEDD